MADNAPWLDYQQPAATAAPAPAAAPTTSTANAPWLDYQAKAAAPEQDFIPHFGPNYMSRLGDSLDSAITTAKQSGVVSSVAGAGEAVAHIITGMVTPIAAVASTIPKQIAGGLFGEKTVDAKGNIVYPGASAGDYVAAKKGIESATNLIPNNPFAKSTENVAGQALSPITAASSAIAKHLTDDPDKQQELTDLLPYTLGAAGEIRSIGGGKPTFLMEDVDSATHMLIKKADNYGVQLTHGQILRAAADDPGTSASLASGLTLPSQIEAAVARSPNGSKMANFYATQQNALADAFADVARKHLADPATKAEVRAAIDTSQHGFRVLDPSAVMDLAKDPKYSAIKDQLHDLVDISQSISPAKPVDLTAQGSSGLYKAGMKLAPVIGGTALGAMFGHTVGLGDAGAVIGLLGGEYAHGQGLTGMVSELPVKQQIARVQKQVTNGPDGFATPADSALSMQDVKAMAKQAGISTDEMSMTLIKRGFNLR